MPPAIENRCTMHTTFMNHLDTHNKISLSSTFRMASPIYSQAMHELEIRGKVMSGNDWVNGRNKANAYIGNGIDPTYAPTKNSIEKAGIESVSNPYKNNRAHQNGEKTIVSASGDDRNWGIFFVCLGILFIIYVTIKILP